MSGAVASSVDGRRFTFEGPNEELELRPGGYAVCGGYLGQVHELEPGERGFARGGGILLDPEVKPFGEVPIEAAAQERVAAWLETVRPARAALDVGELVLQPGLRFALDASGFDRHTFFCGQSGSGKTYALGTVLEQLLLETSLRIVVLDPNSDFVRLDAVRDGIDDELASRYRAATDGLVVRRGNAGRRAVCTCASWTATPRSRPPCCGWTR